MAPVQGQHPSVPWKSVDLAEQLGVQAPTEDERHTALGDAQWVRRIYERVMGGQ